MATTSRIDIQDEDEEECFFNPALFENKTLVTIKYNIRGLEQRVWASNASSTDHDRTGESKKEEARIGRG
jgi:hypothetical protein